MTATEARARTREPEERIATAPTTLLEAPRPRGGHTLAWKLYLATALVVTIVLGATLVVLTILADRTARDAVAGGVERTRLHVLALLEGRERGLTSAALVFAQGPVFRSLVVDARPEDLRDQAAEAVLRTGATWVQITDAAGVRLAKSDEPTAPRDTLAGSALIAGALVGDVVTGVGIAGDTALFQAVAVPIMLGATQVAGTLMAAQTIDSSLATSMRQATGSEIVFFLLERSGDPRIVAATVTDVDPVAELIARQLAGPLDTTLSVAPAEVRIGDDDLLGRLQPLRSAGGAVLGGFVALRSRDAEMAPFATLRRRIALTGVLGLGAAFALSFLLARQITRPLRALADVTRRAAEGDYSAPVEVRGDDEIGTLADAMRSMLSDLHERQALAALAGAAEPEQRPRSSIEAPTLEPGRLLAGRYRIGEVLGVGGNGVVYKATDTELGEVVAIKTLRPGLLTTEPEAIQRMKSEIRLARRISHRNVVRIHDLGEAEGMSFITMEFISGTPLDELIRARAPFSPAATLAIAKQMCRALEVAHEQGIIHRDIKPQNIIVQPDGVLKVMDFGVARPLARATAMTETGMVVGTPAYMAPEQLLGEELDARVDLFAAGVVLYECLTGRRPYESDSAVALVGKILAGAPTPPEELTPAVPRPLSSLVVQLLSGDRNRRPASAVELHERLMRLSGSGRAQPA